MNTNEWTEQQRPAIKNKILTIRQNRMHADALILDLQATYEREYDMLPPKHRKHLQNEIKKHTQLRNKQQKQYLKLVQTYERVYKRKIK